MEFFSYDPLTGIRTDWDYDEETNVATFHRTEDIEALLKVAHETRRDSPSSYIGTSDEKWWPEAIIPATVQAELLKKGIDVGRFENRDATALMKVIEQDYPMLKLTDKKVWIPT